MKTDDLITGLPGEGLIREGLADLEAGRASIPSFLVAVAWRRFSRAGLIHGARVPPTAEPERELYRLLRKEKGDAYSRYNALLRELISFENALDHRLRRADR